MAFKKLQFLISTFFVFCSFLSDAACPVATATPSTQYLCSGNTTFISLTANIPGTTFTWTATPTGGVTGYSSGSGASITQVLNNPGTSPQTVTYTITPTGPSPSYCVGTPITATVIVNPIPTMTVNSNITVNSGQTTSIPLTSSVPGTTFSWTISGGVMGASAGSSSIIAQTLVNNGSTAQTEIYLVYPTANGCVGNPVTVEVTVNAMVTSCPVASASPFNQSVCSGSPASINLSSNMPGTTFAWTASSTGTVTGSAGGSGASITQTLNNPGTSPQTVTYVITPTGPAPSYCVGTPITATITVNPIPTTTANNITVNSGQTTNIPLTSSVPGTIFTWGPSQITGSVTGASWGSGSTIAQVLTNNGSTTGTVTYTITPTANGCAGIPITVVVTVNYTYNPCPGATATPMSQNICSGSPAVIALTANIPGTTFNWTASSTGATGFSAGSGSTINQVLTNPDTSSKTVIYVVTPTGPAPNNCVGSPLTIVVTVNPIPTAIASPQTIVSGQTTNVNLSSSVTGTTYSWTQVSSGVSGASMGTGSIIAQTLNTSGTPGTTGTVTYTITPVGPTPTNCLGSASNVLVTVNPLTTTSISDLEKNLHFVIFPNPSKDFFVVKFSNSFQSSTVILVDVTGKKVAEGIVESINGIQQVRFNCNDLPTAMYFCKVLQGKNVIATEKVFVKK